MQVLLQVFLRPKTNIYHLPLRSLVEFEGRKAGAGRYTVTTVLTVQTLFNSLVFFVGSKMAPDQKDSSSDSIISSSSSSSSSCLSDDGQDGGGVVSSLSSKRTYGLVAQSISNMVRKRRKRMLDENLSVLRSITHSNATRKSCIISDAFKYIEELKLRVRELNRDLVAEVDTRQKDLLGPQSHETGRAISGPTLPTVNVVVKECGLEIHVSCKKSPGLLIAILEAVEALGLNVLQARVSCKDYFLFEALSGKDKQGKIADPHMVKGALLQVLDRINPEKASTAGSEVME